MFAAFREVFFAAREHREEIDLGAILTGGHRLASAIIGVPLGRLAPGYAADVMRLDYCPPTPLTSDNVVGHLLFGLSAAHVRSVWVAGEPVVTDRQLVRLNAAELASSARDMAPDLWSRTATNRENGS